MVRGKLILGSLQSSKDFDKKFARRIHKLATDIHKAGYDRFDSSYAVHTALLLRLVFLELREKSRG